MCEASCPLSWSPHPEELRPETHGACSRAIRPSFDMPSLRHTGEGLAGSTDGSLYLRS